MNGAFSSPGAKEQEEPLLGPLPARRDVKKAVILAAGRGRRMGKLTRDRPKAALEVGGHALIDWQISALKAAGIEQIAVVTGHAADALADRDVTYIHNPDWSRGTQVATLLCAETWIGDEPVIVSYSDILYHPCAPLALLERPGDIIVGYDADHRWLWKRRFGNWLKDSESFVLGPGQVLTEIGGPVTDIEVVDGQFMGLMLLTPKGLAKLALRYRAAAPAEQKRLDFTRLLSALIEVGARMDTAANLLPWMEVDSAKDLRIAQQMAKGDEIKGTRPQLVYPGDLTAAPINVSDEPDAAADGEDVWSLNAVARPADALKATSPEIGVWDDGRLEPYKKIVNYSVSNAFAVQNWGRSGSTFVQSLFDDHPQVLSTPNFYSRRYYIDWAASISRVPDKKKIDVFLQAFRQWWDTGLVDAAAGLHRLGPERNQIAGVKREVLEGYLRMAFADGRPVTRRSLFAAAHLAYALTRGQTIENAGLQILYPIHGEPRGVAAALLEDFPQARFIHTVREPIANLASSIQHLCFYQFDLRSDALETALLELFFFKSERYGWDYTLFSNQQYFPLLQKHDRARLLKLEDLHTNGADVMAAAASWLELQPHEGLTLSTWDGKLWWNRPESGLVSRLAGQPLDRNIENRLGHVDRRKIELMTSAAPSIRVAYGLEAKSSLAMRLKLMIAPWRQEALARRSELRSLRAMRSDALLLPKPLVARLEMAISRECYRARLLVMASGSVNIRKMMADAQKANRVCAVLLITPEAKGFRTRALTKSSRTDRREDADHLVATFLDEAIEPPTAQDHLFSLLTLTLGWRIAQITTWLRVRWLTGNLLLCPRRMPSVPGILMLCAHNLVPQDNSGFSNRI